MKIERTKNTVRNIIFGVLNKIVGIILPFASRTAIIYVLGTKYLGLSSLFSSILSFLSLAEMGAGNALVFSMYKPVASGDKVQIRALVNLYKRFFRMIGVVIFVLGISLMPFLRRLIKGDVPSDVNIYVLYFIYLLNACLNYWLFAYKSSILAAHQRGDVGSKINMVITPLSYVVMLSCLFLFRNYYAYIIWIPVFTIVTNIIRCIYVDRHYPDLKPEGEVDEETRKSITKKVSALIGTKLNTVVLHAADNIVMSAFKGLTTIAIYGNYHYIMSSVSGFLGIAYSAMLAGLGNSIAMESVEKNYHDFIKFSFINSWLVTWCTVCLVTLYQPFMKIWVGEKLMFPFYMVLFFGLYFYIYMSRKIPVTYKDAAGIWWEDRFRPYVCMVTNLVLNIYLVQVIGIPGIILSTIFSLFISVPWENYTIFKYVFHRSSREYYGKMLVYALSMAVGGVACFFLCSLLGDGIPAFLLRMVICLVLPNVVFVLLNYRRWEFKASIELFQHILKLRR